MIFYVILVLFYGYPAINSEDLTPFKALCHIKHPLTPSPHGGLSRNQVKPLYPFSKNKVFGKRESANREPTIILVHFFPERDVVIPELFG
jgi:hypothetical protein